MKKLITQTKKLIDLPYNQFNLDNYFHVLAKQIDMGLLDTDKSAPIKLMSGYHMESGIAVTNCPVDRSGSERKVYIVGKGILFDSGGYNLKSVDEGSYGMHGDKAGMIIGLTVANYLKDNVIAFCPVTTNFLHNSLITPGDIIKIGKINVEVTNTDAEGRLILAEALSALNQNKDDIVITIATLTGGCSKAVDKAVGVCSDNDELVEKYLNASKDAKEYAWRLPLFDYMQKCYDKQPIKNYEPKIKASTSQGGMFVKQFVKYPNNWIHLDIASVAHDKENKATGLPVKSLVNFIKKIK